MADNELTGFSSAFDELIQRNRERLEEKSAHTLGRMQEAPASASRGAYSPRIPEPVFPAGSASPMPAAPSPAGAASRKPEASEAVRRLNERFGDGWSYEITERRRDGDEVIVLCQVSISDQDISKSQFGSARVRTPGQAMSLQGSADGVPLSVELGRAPAARSEDPENAAFRRAVEDALAKCVDLL